MPQFRQQTIDLLHAGGTLEDLAEEFETTAQNIYNWTVQAEREGPKVMINDSRQPAGMRLAIPPGLADMA